MCPLRSPRRRGLLLLLMLCLRPASPKISEGLFQKMDLPAEVTNSCYLTSVTQPTPSEHSSPKFCALQCLSQASCTAFCISGSAGGVKCLLLDAVTVPSGSRAQQASGSCFVRFRPPWPRGTDLARGKAVIVPGAWDDYADKSTVVSGYRCEVSKLSCFCSSYKLISSSYLTVDLGVRQPVTTVVITVSSYHPDFFINVDIRVGDKGDKSDALLKTYPGTPQAGEVLVFQGEVSLLGRYVSLIAGEYSLCVCLVQVYSVPG